VTPAHILFGSEAPKPSARTRRVILAEAARPPSTENTAPIVGRVGAGARVEAVEALQDEDGETVEVPASMQDAVAFRVSGDSCFPIFEHGDVVIAPGKGSADASAFMNRYCIIETDGLGYLKKVRPGSVLGRFDLESPNAETLYAREVTMARPVLMRLIQGGR
jgi:phage repressor protein C with HTH and peptisase S24 domain